MDKWAPHSTRRKEDMGRVQRQGLQGFQPSSHKGMRRSRLARIISRLLADTILHSSRVPQHTLRSQVHPFFKERGFICFLDSKGVMFRPLLSFGLQCHCKENRSAAKLEEPGQSLGTLLFVAVAVSGLRLP